MGKRIELRGVAAVSAKAFMKAAGSSYGEGYENALEQYREQEDSDVLFSAPTVT